MKICPQCNTQYEMDQRFCPKDGSTLRSLNATGDLVGQVVADRYHIVKKLGAGGMGQVYLAEHVRMKRKSAVKVLNPAMVHDADAISRFNREAENASQIVHPNVAAIFDFGETADGLIYLAMEYVDGEPLTNILERTGALATARVASIVKQTADALSAAHDHGIVHRDLKPDNIMIGRSRDGGDLVKVVDFGIAKAMTSDEQNVTKTGLAVGTPEYMSPEQLAGDKLDARTDIYSLGLVAFAMFTGRLPFPTMTSKETLIRRLTDRPQTLLEVRPEVAWPAPLQNVMDRALATDADDRYQSVADFGRDLERAVASMTPTEERHFTASTQKIELDRLRASRGVSRSEERRRRGPGLVLAFLVPLLAIGAAGGWYLVGRGPKTAMAHDTVAAVAPKPDSAQLAAATADSTARADSVRTADSVRVADSLAVAARADSAKAAAPVNANRPELSDEQKSRVADAITSIRSDIEAGQGRVAQGQYLVGITRLRSAADKLAALSDRFPRAPAIRAVRREVDQDIQDALSACQAEADIRTRRGEPAPPCS